MTKLKSILFNKLFLLAVLTVFVAVFTFTSSYFVFVGINALINAIAVIGIVVITGYARQLHLGQAAFLGLGAYTSALLMTKLGWNFWLTMPVAILMAGLFGLLLGLPALKLRGGPYLALVTQLFGEIVYLFLLNLTPITNGPFGILGIPSPSIGPLNFSDLKLYFILCIVFLAIAYFVANRICGSKYGRFFISIKESEEAAQAVGVNTMRYKLLAFTVAAMFGGLAGVLYGPFIGYLSPEQFRWQPSLTLVSMAIVGGMSDLRGGIIGAVVLTFLPELLRSTDQARMILYGALLILTLAFMPDGLISLVGKSWTQIKTMFRSRWNDMWAGGDSEKTVRKLKRLSKQN